jgi:hypothetical protein
MLVPTRCIERLRENWWSVEAFFEDIAKVFRGYGDMDWSGVSEPFDFLPEGRPRRSI